MTGGGGWSGLGGVRGCLGTCELFCMLYGCFGRRWIAKVALAFWDIWRVGLVSLGSSWDWDWMFDKIPFDVYSYCFKYYIQK